ncbi:sensor histidine kinase [Mesorhizobium sp. L-8-10]|uniref:sensor histidine kinase n=1 Tax=Mesorhizobium sp. L-8-10 TaxID=2744523 RepID=UPI001FD5F5EA|nr:ATP-binding protein [Mesorhizobium sp. L-8-10]
MLCLAPTPGKFSAARATEGTAKRILIVYENESTLFAVTEVSRGLREGLVGDAPTRIELYSEHLDSVRFPGPGHLDRQAQFLAAKYKGIPLDIALAAGPGALLFMLEHRDAIAPGAPLVFGGITDATLKSLSLPADIWGVVSRFDPVGTIDLARRLQPTAKRIVVMTGSSDFDRQWEARARNELTGNYRGLSVEYVSGLTLDGFKDVANRLPADTILLILTILQDAAGRSFIPRDAAAEIAPASVAPAYAVYSSFIGTGVVGGFVETFEGIGIDMADLASQIISGAPPERRTEASTSRPVVDWRQLERWGIGSDLLPADTQLEFHEPPVWERYRFEIIAALAVIGLQAATIAGLVILDRRRRIAQEELALERLELAHLSRITQLGQLSGAFAHELNQPLTSILANAEAGARLLAMKPPDLNEVKDILEDIADEDRRAAGIITQLRQLMVKGEAALERVDLNKAVAATMELARSELVARQTQVDFRREEKELPVRGNLAQLQQIVLNLILNATEAMRHLPPGGREITIETRTLPGGARQLSVSDRGPGISPEMKDKAFKPFVSGGATGMGLGLPICRSIASAHGGTLAFDDHEDAGTRVILTLPPV